MRGQVYYRAEVAWVRTEWSCPIPLLLVEKEEAF